MTKNINEIDNFIRTNKCAGYMIICYDFWTDSAILIANSVLVNNKPDYTETDFRRLAAPMDFDSVLMFTKHDYLEANMNAETLEKIINNYKASKNTVSITYRWLNKAMTKKEMILVEAE